jgi:glycosyltransferase involved in cell wall biosynthesis
MMRILIDLQGAQCTSRLRGIGRYSLSLALAMARNSANHEIWLALNSAFPESIMPIRHAFEGLISPERIRIFKVPTPTLESVPSNLWRLRAAEIVRESFILQIDPDVVYVSNLFLGYNDNAVVSVGAYSTETCTAISLYDSIPFMNQKHHLVNKDEREFYFRKIETLKKANLLLTRAESSTLESADALELMRSQLVNVSAAAEDFFSPVSLETLKTQEINNKYKINRKMITYVPGGFDCRRNFYNLLNAFSILSAPLRAAHQLVIIGNIDSKEHAYLSTMADQIGLDKNELILTGYVTDAELVEFYNSTTVFVFPSYHEGFGLPVLEAMTCGGPVIGSDIGSIAEVIGFDEALFDPSLPEEIAKKITRVLVDDSFREKLRTHGLKQASNYSWNKSGKMTIEALEGLIQSKEEFSSHDVPRNSIVEPLQSIAQIETKYKPTFSDIAQTAECIAFNIGRSGPRQLLLDISVIVHGDAKTGIQRVVRSLLRELVEASLQDIEVKPICFDGVRYKYVENFSPPFTTQKVQELAIETVDFCQDDIYLALDLNTHLTGAGHDVHLNLQLSGIKMYFIVYDLLLVQHPEWWPEGSSVIFEEWLRCISEVSTGLICISESVASELRAWLALNPPKRLSGPKVKSFHLGADIESSLPSKGMPDNSPPVIKAIKSTTSFLMVGTIEPRKRHAQTLDAFELLWQQNIDVNLVIVGKSGWLVDTFIEQLTYHPELNKHLFWLNDISDEYLDIVYASCACLLAPSEAEGFGLPLIEAVQHNLPIIARDIPVFHEVAGHHAFYFSGFRAEDLANSIKEWLKLWNIGKNPSSEGMHFLSWRESGQKLIEQINIK